MIQALLRDLPEHIQRGLPANHAFSRVSCSCRESEKLREVGSHAQGNAFQSGGCAPCGRGRKTRSQQPPPEKPLPYEALWTP